jgi:hypothetical protein
LLIAALLLMTGVRVPFGTLKPFQPLASKRGENCSLTT